MLQQQQTPVRLWLQERSKQRTVVPALVRKGDCFAWGWISSKEILGRDRKEGGI